MSPSPLVVVTGCCSLIRCTERLPGFFPDVSPLRSYGDGIGSHISTRLAIVGAPLRISRPDDVSVLSSSLGGFTLAKVSHSDPVSGAWAAGERTPFGLSSFFFFLGFSIPVAGALI